MKAMIFSLLISYVISSTVGPNGENCAQPKTLWEQEACRIANDPKYQPKCMPRKQIPKGPIKGIIIGYHGYTACPDAFDGVMEMLNQQGFMTVVPLLPGQGVKLGYGCEKKGTCVAYENNPSFLPVQKEGYMDWVDWTLKMVKEEDALLPSDQKASDYYIGALGLSAGGPLTLYASSRPDTPLKRVLVANPFYSLSETGTDYLVQICNREKDVAKCINDQMFPYHKNKNAITQGDIERGNVTVQTDSPGGRVTTML